MRLLKKLQNLINKPVKRSKVMPRKKKEVTFAVKDKVNVRAKRVKVDGALIVSIHKDIATCLYENKGEWLRKKFYFSEIEKCK
jgi:hypothetical protein